MDLRNHITVDGIEARYATIEELQTAADSGDDPEVGLRLRTAAAYREVLEVRDQEIVGELIGRMEADPLDHVTIVLEMTTQQAVEEELRNGTLYSAARTESSGGTAGAENEDG